ncbi:P27 family phage terminase small subunit [Phenylobacterium sp.]|uniref:P27 family phage terminase small subunit n=1 Tax=Phenylobacterium sp. TaxID=1871053 RepID=UPI00392F8DC2
MGRRKLPEEQRALHGSVKTRKSRIQRQAEERAAVAAAIAELPVGTALRPPGVLHEPHHAKALEIWNELGPELERTNRLQPIHRQAFAMFCIYMGEWWAACEDLATGGRSQSVPTVSGGVMERDRPAVRWRAEAFANALEAAKQFGLTPREEYALFKDQTVVARENPSLFGNPSAPAPANDERDAPATSIGGMSRLKSAGPTQTH